MYDSKTWGFLWPLASEGHPFAARKHRVGSLKCGVTFIPMTINANIKNRRRWRVAAFLGNQVMGIWKYPEEVTNERCKVKWPVKSSGDLKQAAVTASGRFPQTIIPGAALGAVWLQVSVAGLLAYRCCRWVRCGDHRAVPGVTAGMWRSAAWHTSAERR